jgi:protocatechuate 4,5-dioxygenase beta chain/2,3-dihydroxyphenylpropionate 1,2-dioxygenase
MSHAPGISQFWETMPPERREPLAAAYDQLSRELAALEPDVIVAFINDHFRSFSLATFPTFCIGVGTDHDVPMDGGDAILRMPQRRFRGDPELAEHILESVMRDGFDPAFSGELKFFDDLSVPLRFLYPPEAAPPNVKIVPIMTNCVTRPMPSMQRCHDLGLAVRRALDRFPGEPRRVVILGSGGISHWVGMPRNGDINVEFDRRVIELVEGGRAAEMLAWTDDEIETQAGNGAHELRNWVAAFAAMGQYVPRPLAYVPAPECITGLAAIALDAVDVPGSLHLPRAEGAAL